MARSFLLAPLVVVAACDASLATWEGAEAFEVATAFLTTCEDDLGATHALGIASSGKNCDGYQPRFDEPAASPCDAFKALVADVCDPTATVSGSATDALTFWLADLQGDAGLLGATATSADHYACTEKSGDVWTGDDTELSGSVSVSAVDGDEATVAVDLGELSGTVDFTLCL